MPIGRLTFYGTPIFVLRRVLVVAHARALLFDMFVFSRDEQELPCIGPLAVGVPKPFLDIAFGAALRVPVVVRVRALSKGYCCKAVASWLRWVPLVACPGEHL